MNNSVKKIGTKHYHLIQRHPGYDSKLTLEIMFHSHDNGNKKHSHNGLIGYGLKRTTVKKTK